MNNFWMKVLETTFGKISVCLWIFPMVFCPTFELYWNISCPRVGRLTFIGISGKYSTSFELPFLPYHRKLKVNKYSLYHLTRKPRGLWHSCQRSNAPSELNPPKSLWNLSIGLIAYSFRLPQKNEPCYESFMKIHSLLSKILKYLFSFNHNIVLIVHHPTSNVALILIPIKISSGVGYITQGSNIVQCCFDPKMKKTNSMGGVHHPAQMSLWP